jgi:hypothetical protein
MEEVATVEPLDALRLCMEALEAKDVTMRSIVLWMAETRMCLDSVTMIGSRAHIPPLNVAVGLFDPDYSPSTAR